MTWRDFRGVAVGIVRLFSRLHLRKSDSQLLAASTKSFCNKCKDNSQTLSIQKHQGPHFGLAKGLGQTSRSYLQPGAITWDWSTNIQKHLLTARCIHNIHHICMYACIYVHCYIRFISLSLSLSLSMFAVISFITQWSLLNCHLVTIFIAKSRSPELARNKGILKRAPKTAKWRHAMMFLLR